MARTILTEEEAIKFVHQYYHSEHLQKLPITLGNYFDTTEKVVEFERELHAKLYFQDLKEKDPDKYAKWESMMGWEGKEITI